MPLRFTLHPPERLAPVAARIVPGGGRTGEHPAGPVVPLAFGILSVTAVLAARPVRAFGGPCRSGVPGVISRRHRAEAAFTGARR